MLVRRSGLRASDADREFVAERLRDAAAEGRLEPEELEQRLEAAFSARTYGELTALVSDLPPHRRVERPRRIPLRLRPATAIALVVMFPIALAIAFAAILAVAALLVAWAIAVCVVSLCLGPRARALGSPWAVGSWCWNRRRTITFRL
jgi:hypothetical protein